MADAMANLPCFAGELAAPRHGNPRCSKFARPSAERRTMGGGGPIIGAPKPVKRRATARSPQMPEKS
jgi:hypothetical protein